jgi:predicted metal-binding membrane protein
MTDAALEAVLRRDRAIVAAALFVLASLAWAYVLWLAADMDMGNMDMSGFRMIPAGTALMMPTSAPWNATEFAFVFAMWVVMMVGMMTPSATPMILVYARVGRQAAQQGKPFAASSWFAGGYLLAWVGFALVATFAQWALERGSWLTPKMAAASGVLSGIVLIVTGLYQWTPLKDACLWQCRTPLQFVRLARTGCPSRRLLRRLLLGPDGHIVRRRRDECAVDRRGDDIRVGRKNGSGRPRDFAAYRSGLFRKRRLGAGTNTLGTRRHNVAFGSLADISERTRDVRFTPESGHAERQHRRPLSAISGRFRYLSALH